LITEYDALRLIFNRYPLSLSVSDKEYNDSTFDIAGKVALHFQKVSELMEYPVMMRENQLNAEAYRLLRLKQYKKAEGCFKLYVDNYPNSFNAYNAYGDFYVAIGDKARAIGQFKKALSIREYPATRKKLRKLLE
jgi:TolA-binding protein